MVIGGSPGMWLLGQSDDGTPRVWSLGQNETVVLCTNHGWGNFTNFWLCIQKSIVEKVFFLQPFHSVTVDTKSLHDLCTTLHSSFLYEQEERPACYNYSLSQMCKFYNILHSQLLTAQFFLKLVIGSGSRKVLEATFDSAIFRHCSQQLLFTYQCDCSCVAL